MTEAQIFPLAGAALCAIGLFGFTVRRHPIRRLIALNVSGASAFLVMGALGRGPGATDPVPQALVITGIVVAVAMTAFGLALLQRRAKAPRAERAPS